MAESGSGVKALPLSSSSVRAVRLHSSQGSRPVSEFDAASSFVRRGSVPAQRSR